jgi:uncharacterized protein
MTIEREAAGPISSSQRIAELDVLRGVALFGVLLMNFVGFAGPGVMATVEQLQALPTAPIDNGAYFAVRWLVGDKANTMFATLFGLGFYLQMRNGEGRPGFEARYARRLFWLLVFGWLNALLLWVWDILNLYALAGFALLAMRRWRTRSLLMFGIVAALYSDKLQDWLNDLAGGVFADTSSLFGDAGILERQAVALTGDYPALVQSMWHFTYLDWIAGGVLVAWLIYALGRFALGACIGRSGILDDIRGHLPLLRRIAAVCIPLGLALALGSRLLESGAWAPSGSAAWETLGAVLRSPSALVLAAGYSAGIVVAYHSGLGRRMFGIFAPVGQMALTNYLVQGFLYGFVLFGVGPGLGLAGSIGTSAVILICVAFFALQIVFSRWWLSRYRFGPMEWLWRVLTYGSRQPFRRHAQPAAAAA